jgi:hypothetical protein
MGLVAMKEQIEKLREKLNDLVIKQSTLTHQEIVKLSKELDELIYYYYSNVVKV